MEKFTRNSSIIDNRYNVQFLHSFKDFPVFIGATDAPYSTDLFADMTWDICETTGCIQLRNPLDPEIIYSGYHSEALGSVWHNHHQQFKQFCGKYIGPSIVEIGGSNGRLAYELLNEYSDIEEYTIIEPNPHCSPTDRLKILDTFFTTEVSENFAPGTNLVLHSHTLEHTYDPIDFITGINILLENGGIQIFSIPNLQCYLDNKFSNTLNFEHTYFLTETLVEELMQNCQFRLIDKMNFQDHSIFYAYEKDTSISRTEFSNKYLENKSNYQGYIAFYKNEINNLNDLINKHEGDIFLFGAHIFSQFLLNFGLEPSNIQKILDNSDVKCGKRLYGTELFITKPEAIVNSKAPAVILKAGQYQSEIKSQLLSLRSDCVIFE